jgi:hypothetical protein
MAMMFQGAYTNEFYRALHDALHAQVDSWSWRATAGTQKKQSRDERDELWRRVMHLEKTCRNPRPTVLNCFPGQELVQLQAPVYATSFDDLLSVLAS